jgi:hypothetical protein
MSEAPGPATQSEMSDQAEGKKSSVEHAKATREQQSSDQSATHRYDETRFNTDYTYPVISRNALELSCLIPIGFSIRTSVRTVYTLLY